MRDNYTAKLATLEAEADTIREQASVVSFGNKETRVEDIRREIDAAVSELSDPKKWQEWLDCSSKFHSYSFGNTMLIKIQNPNATRVAGFNKWKELGRAPSKGQKAIWIQAPMTVKRKGKNADEDDGKKDKDDDDKFVIFRPVPVFDVSQTEGDPLPEPPLAGYSPTEGEAPEGMKTSVEEAIAGTGFALSYEDLPDGGPEGYTNFSSKRVVVRNGYSGAHEAMVLVHELAHIELGHGDNTRQYHTGPGGERDVMEVEAESVAYIIGRKFGLEAPKSSFAYIHDWAKGDTAKVKSTANRVTKAANSLVKKLGLE